MCEGHERRWFQFSLRTLFVVTGVVGVVAALISAGYPGFGLFGVMPFSVGIMWGQLFHPGRKRAMSIVMAPVVAAFVGGAGTFVVALLYTKDVVMASIVGGEFAIITVYFGAIPAIAGSLVAQSTRRKSQASENLG
jgi:hypothetical protein